MTLTLLGAARPKRQSCRFVCARFCCAHITTYAALRCSNNQRIPPQPSEMSTDPSLRNPKTEKNLSIKKSRFKVRRLYNPLSDRYDRKKMLLAGLTLFLLANTLCAFSNVFSVLLAARFFAELGMGALISFCFITRFHFPGWESVKIQTDIHRELLVFAPENVPNTHRPATIPPLKITPFLQPTQWRIP
jgi:hypothetical protein